MVAPKDLKTVKSWLERKDISFDIVLKNVKEEIDKEMKSIFSQYQGMDSFYDCYQTLILKMTLKKRQKVLGTLTGKNTIVLRI